MTRVFARLNRFLGAQLPEQRIYFRTEQSTRYVRATPLAQLLFGLTVTGLVCWSVLATSALMIDRMNSQSSRSQTEVLRTAYEARLTELSEERDQRALEAQTAQQRFYVALEQLSLQQSELLSAEQERRELATGLKLMQQKLQKAVVDRDAAQTRSDAILAEMQEVTGSINTQLGEVEDTRTTLDRLASVLDQTASERDAMAQEMRETSTAMADIELERRLVRDRQEQIFRQVEQAVDLTMTPLSQALKRAGVDTEALLNQIKAGYSGAGGPLMPLLDSHDHAGGALPDMMTERTKALIEKLDRVGLMKLAAQQLPLAMPVKGAFRYTSGFGYRRDPFNGSRKMHSGIDMAGALGLPIYATGEGVVTFAGRKGGYGRFVEIKHNNGYVTYYAHLHRIRVKSGQRVSQGDRIGDMGNSGRSTGVHLHYEVRVNGKAVNPLTYMKAGQDVF